MIATFSQSSYDGGRTAAYRYELWAPLEASPSAAEIDAAFAGALYAAVVAFPPRRQRLYAFRSAEDRAAFRDRYPALIAFRQRDR